LEFRILGPLEVVGDNGLVALGGGKQRALLALLLLRANEVVASDTLIDELWHGEPPDTARKALQVHVSNLRKALGSDRIATQPPGYRIRVDTDELDLARFEALRAAGDASGALALWRGAPLADFAYEPFAAAERGRLEELRLVTLEQRIEADLARGRHADLVPELEALVAAEPLRERPRAQLMLALYRCGRQADALEVYQAGRRALVDELGIDPGRELQELERAILRQEPSLEAPAREAPRPQEPARPRTTGVLVGRETELKAGLAALDDALAGRGRLLLVAGEPGIGKSRLVDELADRAAGGGAEVLIGRCWEAGGAPPYWPWTQALREHARRTEPRALREQLGQGAADLAGIVPELRSILDDIPDPTSPETEGARIRLFESVAAFLDNASRARPLVICLDDVHAADTPSLLLLQFVSRELERMPVLVVAAYRDVDPTVSTDLAETVAAASRSPATTRVSLTGLSRDEARTFVEVNGGAAHADSLAGRLHEDTEGNPLFMGEILRLLAAEGRLEEAGTTISIPDTVREVIGRRLRHLSSECRRVLTLAAVLGREFGLVALERVADYTGIDRLLEVLDEAITARVVAELPGSLGRLRFSHALIRDTLYGDLPATHRVRLHKRAAEVLEELYSNDLEPHLAELAHHYVSAIPALEPARAAEFARRAGDRALRLLAYEEASRLYELALSALSAGGTADEIERCELLLALGEARARAGLTADAKTTFLEAADLARRSDRPAELARAALGYGGRIVWSRAGGDEVVPLLEDALDRLEQGDSALRAKLLARLAGGALRGRASPDEREALSAEAVEIAERLEDSPTLAYALDARFAALHTPDNPRRRLAIASELVRVAEIAGDVERQFQGHIYAFVSLLHLGETAAADTELDLARELAERMRQPAQLWQLHSNLALRAFDQGLIAEAEAEIETALEFGKTAQTRDATLTSVVHRYLLQRHQGRLGELLDEIETTADAYPDRPILRCLLASACCAAGDESRARSVFEAIDARALPLDDEWLFTVCLLAEVCAVIGDSLSAGTLYELLIPFWDQNAVTPPEGALGSVSRYLALLAWTMQAYETAAAHFEAALAANEAMGASTWVAATRADLEHASAARRRALEPSLERASLLARAALGYGGRLAWGRSADDDRFVPLLEEALDALGDQDAELRIRLLSRLAGALRDEHSRERRDRLSAEAVELARASGNLAALAHALSGRGVAICAPDALDELLSVGTELCEVAERAGSSEDVEAGYQLRILALFMSGDVAGAERDHAEAGRLARSLKQPVQMWNFDGTRAMLDLAKGRLDAAERSIEEALAIGEAVLPAATPIYWTQRYTLCDFLGRLQEVEAPVLALVDQNPTRPVFRCVCAHLQARLGLADEARATLGPLRSDLTRIPFDQEWLYAVSLLAETVVLLGDAEAAETLYPLLLPWEALNAVDVAEGFRGSIARYLGLLAAYLGHPDDAVRHLEHALEENLRMGALPWLAHTKYDLARVFRSRGDTARAEELLNEALALYDELGMVRPSPA
jgi:DNA-binding SARP family transcriptional activator